MSLLRRMIPRANFVNGAVFAGALMITPLLYWQIVDRRPAASSVSEIISDEVEQGDFLQIEYEVVWRSRCEIIAFRYIIDEMQVEWPISAQQRIVQPEEDGEPSVFTIRIPVPLAAAPGEAEYRGTLRFSCNPLQRFLPLEQELRPRSFTIRPNPDLAWQRRQGIYEGPPIMRRFAGFNG